MISSDRDWLDSGLEDDNCDVSCDENCADLEYSVSDRTYSFLQSTRASSMLKGCSLILNVDICSPVGSRSMPLNTSSIEFIGCIMGISLDHLVTAFRLRNFLIAIPSWIHVARSVVLTLSRYIKHTTVILPYSLPVRLRHKRYIGTGIRILIIIQLSDRIKMSLQWIRHGGYSVAPIDSANLSCRKTAPLLFKPILSLREFGDT